MTRETVADPGDLAGPPAPERLRALLDERAPGAGVAFTLPTGTRVDVGSWFGKRRVWVAGVGDRLLLAACGPRPFFEERMLAGLRESVYNPVTRALILAPGAGVVNELALGPRPAYALMDYIGAEQDSLRKAYRA